MVTHSGNPRLEKSILKACNAETLDPQSLKKFLSRVTPEFNQISRKMYAHVRYTLEDNSKQLKMIGLFINN